MLSLVIKTWTRSGLRNSPAVFWEGSLVPTAPTARARDRGEFRSSLVASSRAMSSSAEVQAVLVIRATTTDVIKSNANFRATRNGSS